VRDSEQECRLLFESVKDYAIYSTLLNGTIEKWNAGATTLFGFESIDMIGHNYSELFSPDDRAAGIPENELESHQKWLDTSWNLTYRFVDRW
jgi:two-component system CheB/CheR fusion protein